MWLLNARKRRRAEVFNIKCLRKVLRINIDWIRNQDIQGACRDRMSDPDNSKVVCKHGWMMEDSPKEY